MTPGSRLNQEIEAACMAFRICVLARNPRKLPVSVWSMPDPSFHVGVVWRANAGGAKFGLSFVRFGPPGLADYQGWLFKTGQMIQIEGKAGLDRLSRDQAAFHKIARQTGVLNGCAGSWSDCLTLLESWGLKRV